MNDKRRLIGELTEENGEYTFKYRLGDTLPEWYLKLEYFPDITKIYKGAEVRPFVEVIVPDRNLWCMSKALEPQIQHTDRQLQEATHLRR
jgi:hypothetical protein